MRKMPDWEYLAGEGLKCPACKDGDAVAGDFLNSDGTEIVQAVSCDSCPATWKDVYKLSGYTGLEVGEQGSPDVEEDEEPQPLDCPMCVTGQAYLLGKLGAREHFKCRACGHEMSRAG